MNNRFLAPLFAVFLAAGVGAPSSAGAAFTVADNYAALRYVATASQTSFTVGWPFEAEGDLVVQVDAGATGAFVTKTLASEYTTTGQGTTNGGTVVMLTGLASGDIIVITRDSGVTDGTAFGSQATTSAMNLRFGQDALAIQEVESDVRDRALLLPETGPGTVSGALPSASASAGKLVGYKSDGTGFEAVSSSLNGSSPTTVAGGTYAAQGTPIVLRNGNTATREAVTLDTAECTYDTDRDAIYCGDGATAGGLIASGLTRNDGVFNVKDCGATGDGATDDNTAIQACVTLAKAAAGTLVFPPGTYAYSAPIDLSSPGGNGVNVIGIGAVTLLKTTLTSPALLPGSSALYENFSIRFSTRPGSSDLRAVGIQLGGGIDRDASTSVSNSVFRRINIYQSFVAILAGPVAEAGEASTLLGASFANSWDTILIRDFYQSAIIFDIFSGNDTGESFTNLQIKNKEWDNAAQVNQAGTVMLFSNFLGATFNTTHIDNIGDEDAPTGAPKPILKLSNGASTTSMVLNFNTLHIENTYYDTDDASIFELYENVVLNINGLDWNGNTIAAGSGNNINLVGFMDDNGTAIIEGLTLKGNVATTGTFRQSATNGSKSGCAMYVRGFYEASADVGNLTVDETANSVSDGKPLLKQWNDRVYYQETKAQGMFATHPKSATIATAVITPSGTEMTITVDTEGAAATDQLDGINESPAPVSGQIYILKNTNTARVVTVRSNVTVSGADRFDLSGQTPMVLAAIEDRLVVQYEASTGRWAELGRRESREYKRLQFRANSALTVSTSTIAPTGSRHRIDNSGGTQTVATITAPIGSVYDEGFTLLLSNSTTGNTVTYNETGNIILSGGTTFAADTTADTLWFLYDSTLSKWIQIGGGDNS
jgi:hypothetical protein